MEATAVAVATRADKMVLMATTQMEPTATAEAPRRAKVVREAPEVGEGMAALEELSLAVMGIARRALPQAVAVQAGLVVERQPATIVPAVAVRATLTRLDAP